MSTIYLLALAFVNIFLITFTFVAVSCDYEDREFWLWLALGAIAFVNLFGIIFWNMG